MDEIQRLSFCLRIFHFYFHSSNLGRFVPTTPWDTIFGGIASWLGIKESDLDTVCPNLHNFDSSYLIDAEEMFNTIEVPVPTPSESPSESPICRFDEVSDTTYYFVVNGVNGCWRLELFERGTLEVDFTDPTSCSNVFASTGMVYSEFDYVDGAKNTVVYKEGTKGYKGSFQFEESVAVTKTEATLLSWKPQKKEFEVKLTIPSCTMFM